MTRKITDKTVDEEIVARFIKRDYIHWDRMMRTGLFNFIFLESISLCLSDIVPPHFGCFSPFKDILSLDSSECLRPDTPSPPFVIFTRGPKLSILLPISFIG